MELEELKEKWNILSEELSNQKIVNQNLLEKMLKDKIKTKVSDFNYAIGLLYVLLVVLFFLIFKFNIPYKTYMIVILALTAVYGIYGIFVTNNLKKVIKPTLSLCEREKNLVQYKKHVKLSYIFISFIFIPMVMIFKVIFDMNRGMPWWFSVISIFLMIILPSCISYRYGKKEMKKIEESFKEYKEFMSK